MDSAVPTLREFFRDHPNIAQQWSSSNDDSLLEKKINSATKVSWCCEVYGCDYQKTIRDKIRKPDRCSVCHGFSVFPGYNDLVTVNPEVAAQWDIQRNTKTPDQVKPSSSQYAWWRCAQGHSWRTKIYHRTGSRSQCPQCQHEKNRQAQLATSLNKYGSVHDNPHMSTTFLSSTDPKTPLPHAQSHVVCVWKCDKGHQWECSPKNYAGCPLCVGKKNAHGDILYVSRGAITDNKSMLTLFSPNNDKKPSEVSLSSALDILWICDKGHEWIACPYSVKRSLDNGTNGCPSCCHQVSAPEREIVECIESLLPGVELITNTRKLIPPREVDIYLPDHQIAIEYNGLFFHDEQHTGYDKNYHYEKWRSCKEQGVQLITLWEDEWLQNRELILAMISHKLGVNKQRTVYGRNTRICHKDAPTARLYADKYHIQGFTAGGVYLALEDKTGEIVALSIWRKNKNTLYLDRYCTSARVVGGMGKLLKQGISYAKEYGCDRIITFSDHAVSNGGLYEKLGFTNNGVVKPDYSYVVDKRRVHKFNYRRKKFENDPVLLFDPDLSERELAALNNIPRIWDCGKTRWELAV